MIDPFRIADLDSPPASILTPSQRQFLLGESDAADSARRAMRGRIRARVRAAVLDSRIILQHIDPEELSSAFDPLGLLRKTDVIADGIGFLYLSAVSMGMESVEGRGDRVAFAKSVEDGIRGALNRHDVSVKDVSVRIEIELGDPLDELAEGDLSEYSVPILQQLLITDKITPETFGEVIAKRRGERPTEDTQ